MSKQGQDILTSLGYTRHYLTLYGHIKTAEQQTIIQQYSNWYTGC